MKCIFVGDLEDDAGFVAEVLQEKGIELIEAGVYDQIEKTINPVIEAQAEIVVYDLLVLSDQPDELVDIINRIQQSRNGAKIIFLAAGKGTNTPVIDKLLKAGYVNFVLESTYGAKKTKFARCLTNYYESNAGNVNQELKEADLPHELHFIAFAGTQSRIGTTTQALQYAGYLADCGEKVCYVEETSDGVPHWLLGLYQYAVETGDCITYAGIPMYERKPMQELLKMDYEYFVLDMGSMKQEQFLSTLFFDSRVKRVIVAGAKPQEWIHTKTARANVLCRDASYIISFASNEDIVGISSSFANPPLFAAWIPDMFARDQEDLKAGYGYLFSEDRKKKKSVSESDTGKHRKHSRSSRAGRTS